MFSTAFARHRLPDARCGGVVVLPLLVRMHTRFGGASTSMLLPRRVHRLEPRWLTSAMPLLMRWSKAVSGRSDAALLTPAS